MTMMNIGELLKKYRLQLGLTQKEMAQDILTASYYSKVERSEHKISAEDLFAILSKHSIDRVEFIGDLEHQTEEMQYFEKLNSDITLYYYQQNVTELHKMTARIESNDQLSSFYRQLLLSLNELVLYNITEKEDYLTEENKAFLKKQFFETENWNSFKLSLYTNIMNIYDFHSNHAIISSLLSKKIESYESIEQVIILYILNNFTNDCLLNDSLLLAKHYNDLVLNTPSNYNNVLQKILAKYHDYLFNFLENPSLEKEEKALDFIQVFKEIDFGLYEPSIELLEDLKELYLK